MTDVGMFPLIKAESRGVGAAAWGLSPALYPDHLSRPGKQSGNAREKLPDPGDSLLPPTSPGISGQAPLTCPQLPSGSKVQPGGQTRTWRGFK